jgi:hypothetical protein
MSQLYVGFIVNIFNSLNFDIFIENYNQPAYGNEFSYMDEDQVVKTGKTYRCRLSGILRKKNPIPHDEYMKSVKSLNIHIQKLNGWVLLKIKGDDKFKRLLVELYDMVTGTCINDELRDNKLIYINYSI